MLALLTDFVDDLCIYLIYIHSHIPSIHSVTHAHTFIPFCHTCTHTTGEISHIHANGRINYSGQLPTRSDGSDVGAEAALKAAERLQAVAARLAHKEQQHKQLDDQQQGEQGEEGNNSDIEDELDRALDDVLDAEMADGDGDDYSNSESGADAAEEDDEYAYGWDDADESESEKGACFGANSDGEHNSSSEGSDEEAGAISQVVFLRLFMCLSLV